MIIPKTVKIGGKTYRIEQTTRLDLGKLNCSGEIDYMNLEIRIVPAAQERMEVVLLHELTHAIFDHLGHVNHDEKLIDELANALHMVIKDNPDMFKEE